MSETTCYGHSSPNAVILPNYGPCNPQAGSISLCCETGQTCLTNGLCVTQSGVYYSGGCTDNTYEAAVCPTFCTAGDANWVVECHGSAVKDGDFCCSVNGTTTACCDTASNGLGLDAAVSSAQAVSATSVGESTVSASVSASTLPKSISNDATTPSSASITDSLTFTSLPTATSQIHGSTGISRSEKVEIGVIVPVGVLGLIFIILYFRRWIKRREHRRARIDNALELRRESSDKSGPQALPTEVEGSQVATEVEGSPVGHLPVEPVEMDAWEGMGQVPQ